MSFSKVFSLLALVIVGIPTLCAQDLWVELEMGVVERTESFPLPEGSGFPMQTEINYRPMITLGLAGQLANHITLYGKAGYGTLQQQLAVGPLLTRSGIGFEQPFTQPFLFWEGTYLELGAKYPVWQGLQSEATVGLGGGHAYNYQMDNLIDEYPANLIDGTMYAPGLFEIMPRARLHSPHAFFLVPQVQFTFFGRRHRPFWIKASYHQGITKVVQGEFVYVRELAPDDSIEREFSFSFVRRLSFFSVGIGVGLFHFRLGEPDPSELY